MLEELLPELRQVVEDLKVLKEREEVLRKTCLEIMTSQDMETYTSDELKLTTVTNARRYDADSIKDRYPDVYALSLKPAVDTAKVRASIEFLELDEEQFNATCSRVSRPHLRVTLAKRSE